MQMKVWYGLTPCSLYGIYLYNQCNKQLFEEQLWKARTVKKISRSISTVKIQHEKFYGEKALFLQKGREQFQQLERISQTRACARSGFSAAVKKHFREFHLLQNLN